jgi:hypothetical protein
VMYNVYEIPCSLSINNELMFSISLPTYLHIHDTIMMCFSMNFMNVSSSTQNNSLGDVMNFHAHMVIDWSHQMIPAT